MSRNSWNRERRYIQAEVQSVQELRGRIGKEQRVAFAYYRGCWESGGESGQREGKPNHRRLRRLWLEVQISSYVKYKM